jgi:glucose/arabinose dehydrogenase
MPAMRTITTLALTAALVVGAAAAVAAAPSTPVAVAMLQASPSVSPAPSTAPSGLPAVSPAPSIDPCPSPVPSPSADPSVLPAASALPSSPAASAAPAVSPSSVPASLVPASPDPSAAPTIDPCASPEPTGRGFRPGRVRLDLEKVVDGLSQPVYVTGTGDGSGDLFVVLREGEVRILDPRTGRLRRFLDIRDRVDTLNERGLHAIALDPRYARNGHFYVHYNGPDGDTQVVRFTGKPGDGQVRVGTAKRILRFNQPFENHNGGWLGFGPDDRLYLALGDGGGNAPGDPLGNGQDRGQPLAKILRVDPDTGRYTTYAWGLRNPWRASFDRETGDLWIGDVGQNEVEEIDIVKAGRENPPNFGWSVMEGSRCHRGPCNPDRFVLPVTEYSSAPGARECSVMGGYVYRGEAQPMLQGAYVYGDFCSGRIWAIRAEDGRPGAELTGRQMATVGSTTLVSFGEDDAGELYVITGAGGIFRLVAQERGGGG